MHLVESGTVRILDLIFIGKDADGSVIAFEFDELDESAGFGGLDGEVGGLVAEDIEYAAAAWNPILRRHCWSGRTCRRRGSPMQCATPRASCSRGTNYPHELIAPRWRICRQRSSQPRDRRTTMMRRRPIARAAVRTTAVVGTAAVVGGHMANKQAAQAQQVAARIGSRPASAPAPGGPDPIEQLTRLAALKDSGALTEAEFDAQKAKISWLGNTVLSEDNQPDRTT